MGEWYGNGGGGVIAPTYGAAGPVVETADCGLDDAAGEVGVFEVAGPGRQVVCRHWRVVFLGRGMQW